LAANPRAVKGKSPENAHLRLFFGYSRVSL
jgi:hypothetical protein